MKPTGTIVPLLLLAICLTGGCTVTPKRVQASSASFDGGAQNSGLIGFDQAGNAILTAHGRDRYNGLVAVYGCKFSPPVERDAGMTVTSTNTFLLDPEHLVDFETMNGWRKACPP